MFLNFAFPVLRAQGVRRICPTNFCFLLLRRYLKSIYIFMYLQFNNYLVAGVSYRNFLLVYGPTYTADLLWLDPWECCRK
uniref:Uncharacterized protein n=1 Tax=Anguilla anguilla TaxID=7936 RepID=A0A0E9WDB0_ANGAN